MNLKIRQERATDYLLTEQVVKMAFADAVYSDHKEHLLVSRIRRSDHFIPELSLTAIDSDHNQIAGHILLSKITIVREDDVKIDSLALAPVSVFPEYQNKGIGGLLITEALKEAKGLGHNSVVVLGHPQYYPKFGFQRASLWGIKAPFEVPDEAFMAIELSEDALKNAAGIVEYPSEFFN